MSKKNWAQAGEHFGLGLAFTIAILLWFPLVILVTFIWAWLREQAQHRYIVNDENRIIGEHTFFGWTTWHSMKEVFQWTAGSAVGVAIWYVYG